MKHSEIKALAEGVAPVVRELLDKATSALIADNKALSDRLTAMEKRLALEDKLGLYATEGYLQADDGTLESLAGQIAFRFAEYLEAFTEDDDSPEATDAMREVQRLAAILVEKREQRLASRVQSAPALFPNLKVLG